LQNEPAFAALAAPSAEFSITGGYAFGGANIFLGNTARSDTCWWEVIPLESHKLADVAAQKFRNIVSAESKYFDTWVLPSKTSSLLPNSRFACIVAV
jgi:hypothetical protein